MILFRLAGRIFPTRPLTITPRRIVLILPCCIGDVVMATAALKALRRAYPQAHITWAVGTWSRQAIEHHDMLDAVLDTGPLANPAALPHLMQFVRKLRHGRFDLAVSLVRSPLMSLAVWLSGIPHRAGLDSAGRGFGYNLRVPVDPAQARHEAEIYLDVIRALGADTTDCYVNVPVHTQDEIVMRQRLENAGIHGDYVVINPAGGQNPGMVMDSKRWPPQNFAAFAEALAQKYSLRIVLIGGPADHPVIDAMKADLTTPAADFTGMLIFNEIAALAKGSRVYVGNDTGLTHLAAAAGAKTVMIMGPSDPERYAPFTPDSIALWKPASLNAGGVAAGTPVDWNWQRDGIGVDAVIEGVMTFIDQ